MSQMSVREAASRLGVSAKLVYALCAAGRIAHERFGLGRGTIRITEEARETVKSLLREQENRDFVAETEEIARQESDRYEEAEAMQEPRPRQVGRTVVGLLTVKQAAQKLGVSGGLVYGLVAARKIRHERHGLGRGHIRIPEDALDEYRQSVTTERAEPAVPPRPRRSYKHVRV